MSKIALEGNSLGSGTFTIAAPNSNSNPTLTLPTSSGTVVVTGGAQTIEFAAGSAASPSITFTGDTNTGIFSPGADTIAFSEGGTESMRINSSGNVGIGTSSPTTMVELYRDSGLSTGTGTTIALRLSDSGADGGANTWNTTQQFTALQFYSADASDTGATVRASVGATMESTNGGSSALTFFTNSSGTPAERMRINSSGNVGIGTTSPSGRVSSAVPDGATNALYLERTGGSPAQFSVTFANQFSNLISSGVMTFAVNGSERARITSDGYFLIGTTTTTNDARLVINNPDNVSGDFAFVSLLGSNCNNTSSYHYIAATGGSDKYYIYGNGTTGTPSDIRLKKNVETARNGYLEDLVKLRIVKYNWKTDEENTPKELGVIAQEVEQVFPGIVSTKTDEQTEEETKSVKHSVFVPMLIKAVQELKAITDAQATRIEALEAEVAALKGQ